MKSLESTESPLYHTKSAYLFLCRILILFMHEQSKNHISLWLRPMHS